MTQDLNGFVGRPVERLSLNERILLAGQWIALELYNPVTIPMRFIEAIGPDARACTRQLVARGRDPKKFEYLPLSRPY